MGGTSFGSGNHAIYVGGREGTDFGSGEILGGGGIQLS